MIPTTRTVPRIHDQRRPEYWINVFGSRSKLARVLRLKSRRPIDGWIERGEIPARYVFFLKLYIGEITFADWEDSVES